jgi:hypothetical protein
MFLTTVPPDVFKQQEPEMPRPPRGGGGNAAGGPEIHAGDTPSDDNKTRVDRPNQNANLRSAWAATQQPKIFGLQSPFYDTTARGNKKVVPSDRPSVRVCLPMALRGSCYDNCTGKHDTLSAAEVRRVAEAGNLTVT